MNLATHQRKLLSLFRSAYQPSAGDDEYIQRVANSRDLNEARKNILMWRFYVLERTAVLTFTLLKQRKLLTEMLKTFIAQYNISPFRETQAPAFLEMMSDHPDALIGSVARFELALFKVRQGDRRRYVVSWGVEPHSVLNSLAKNQPLEDDLRLGGYQTLIGRDLPGHFQIVRLEQNPPIRSAGIPAGHLV